METEINLFDKSIEVNEILAYDFDKILEIESSADRLKSVVVASSNLTEDEYKKLTTKNRTLVMEQVNKINGWGKSQETTNSKK